MYFDKSVINLKPTNRVGHGCFSVRRYASGKKVDRRILVLDDDLIGDAAICALRARTIDGTINPVELILLGFDVEDYEKLHACRGEFYTNRELDLSFSGIVKTGRGKELKEFIGNIFKSSEGCDNSVLGYSLSGLFAARLFLESDYFDRVGLISPVLWVDPDVGRSLQEAVFMQPERTVFLAAGEMEEELIRKNTEAIKPENGRPFNGSSSGNLQSLVHQFGMGCDHTATITAMMDRAILALASDRRLQEK